MLPASAAAPALLKPSQPRAILLAGTNCHGSVAGFDRYVRPPAATGRLAVPHTLHIPRPPPPPPPNGIELYGNTPTGSPGWAPGVAALDQGADAPRRTITGHMGAGGTPRQTARLNHQGYNHQPEVAPHSPIPPSPVWPAPFRPPAIVMLAC